MFFIRFLNWFTLRQFRIHPWRVLAVLFGIALGAAVYTSIRLAVYASVDSFTRSMDLLSGKADWTVVRPGGRLAEGLVARLLSHPAVETASPLITSYVSVSNTESEPFILLGLDPILDHSLRQWKIDPASGDVGRLWLDLLRRPFTLFLSRRLAEDLGLGPGDTVELEHVHRARAFEVLGLLEQEGLSLFEGGRVAITDMASMQEFTGLQGWVDRVDLRLSPQEDPEALRELRGYMPSGVSLEAPTEARETGKTLIRAYEINLSVLSFVSLFVGMFLVYSLVSLNAASRRRELAILRSMGASSRLVFLLVLSEGVMLGMAGWLLAVPVGSFFVKYLVRGVSSTITNLFVRVRVEDLHLDLGELLLSFVLTVFVSFAAAYKPARDTMRIAPREAMMTQGPSGNRKYPSHPMTILGILMIALTWPIAKLPELEAVQVNGYAAVFFLVVGFAILSSPILRWMGSYLPPLLRRMGGEPAYLGGRYVREGGGRTAISVGALVTAASLFVALVIMVHSFRHTVSLWVHQTVSGDFFIRPKVAGLNRYQYPLPQDVVEPLQRIPSVELIPYRHLELTRDGVPYEFEAVRIEPFLRRVGFLMMAGNLDKIRGPLLEGEGVIVSEVFSNQTGLTTGDRYQVVLGDATIDLPVLGVFRDYRTRGGIVYMSLSRFQELTGDGEWSGVRFFFKENPGDSGKTADWLRGEIFKCCGHKHPLDMASGVELRREILDIFDQTFAVTTVLLLIALLVAGLGITTTLTVLVLERIRQLHTLSAVGAAAGQIRAMIFWEALLMVLTGEITGLICGFCMSYFLIYVVNLQSFGWTFLYRVNWSHLAIAMPLILATALLAALPAVRIVLRSSPALVLKEQ